MVATSGAGWVLAPCLVRLIDETDRLFPGRSKTSDGSIGDAAHATRLSDHNPDDGYVRAVDVTDDDAHGCDASVLAHHLVATQDRRVKYLIHKGTIWKSYPNSGLVAWTPQVYTGPSPHTHHLHVSVLDGHENDRGTWWPQSKPTPPKPTEDSMIRLATITGESTAPGDQQDTFAIYRVVSHQNPAGKPVDYEAHWVENGDQLKFWKGLLGEVDKKQISAGAAQLMYVHGGPFKNVI